MPIIDVIEPMARRSDAATGFDPTDAPLMALVNTLSKSLKPLYVDTIVTCIWSAMLIPLSVVLIFFSDHKLRRKPVFIANIFAISVGIAFSGAMVGQSISMLLDPLSSPNIPLFLTIPAFLGFGPLLVDSVLLIRLWAVYPFKTTPGQILFVIYVPIALLKLGRFINATIYFVEVSKRAEAAPNALWLLQKTWTSFPNYKIGWLLEVADNTTASILFLVKLNKRRTLRSITRLGRFRSTLNSLFWIAVYNFVIPVILIIAELIVIWTTTDIFRVVPICVVNLYVEIIGVLLATVWAAGTRWQDTHNSDGSGVHISTTVEVDIIGVDVPPVSLSSNAQVKNKDGAR